MSDPAFYFMTAVCLIQGGHVVEHIVQLAKVLRFRVAEDDALGVSDTVLELGYNAIAYAGPAYVVVLGSRRAARGRASPRAL